MKYQKGGIAEKFLKRIFSKIASNDYGFEISEIAEVEKFFLSNAQLPF